jgi:hypothetical protein
MALLVLRRLGAVVLALAAAAVFAVPVHAQATRTAIGQGSTAQFRCPSGVTVPATINFFAQKNRGSVFGNYEITGADVSKFGTISGGTINQSRYSLQGITTLESCAGVLFVPVNATLSGRCGTAVVIHYVDALGQRGDFLGNVACT